MFYESKNGLWCQMPTLMTNVGFKTNK